MASLIKIPTLEAAVNDTTGELCSIKFRGEEFMWGGGRPEGQSDIGWKHSAIIMFPLVGPPLKDELGIEHIVVDGEKYPMTQHGIARHIPMSIKREGEVIKTSLVYTGEKVGILYPLFYHEEEFNSLFNAQFPRSFTLAADYSIQLDKVVIAFSIRNDSRKNLRYSFGYHPAFNTIKDGVIQHGNKEYTLEDIYAAKALLLDASKTISYGNDKMSIELSHNLGNIMVWSPREAQLICLEPVTGLPKRTENGGSVGSYNSRKLKPSERKAYQVKITPRFLE